MTETVIEIGQLVKCYGYVGNVQSIEKKADQTYRDAVLSKDGLQILRPQQYAKYGDIVIRIRVCGESND